MSGLRACVRGGCKFYAGGVALYPEQELYKEMSFIAYYYHWSQEEVMGLEHMERRRWCDEISAINRGAGTLGRRDKSILEWRLP